MALTGDRPRLTALSHGAGCACKIGAAELRGLREALPPSADPDLLVGLDPADDAAVYRLSDEPALVQSLDFFTPIVDDPRDFGRIAAANALSDLYAMGARPLLALNVVAFSLGDLGGEPLAEILAGGAEVAAEAGVAIGGGYSVDDLEPKYGMVVSGVAHPDEILTAADGRPGDELFLSKPLGGGLVTTAAKRGLASEAEVDVAVATMTTLNAAAAAQARAAGAHALTDVTGFGAVGARVGEPFHRLLARARFEQFPRTGGPNWRCQEADRVTLPAWTRSESCSPAVAAAVSAAPRRSPSWPVAR